MQMSPYARFNLRRNPFGELCRAERAELAVVDAQRWLDALTRPATVIQFIGPAGHGKTTHLLAIERLLPHATYIYLPEVGPQPDVPARRPLLIDEAQRLGPRQRRQTFQAGGPLVLGTHDDLESELCRYNLQVQTIHVAQEQSPERLMEIMNKRIEASRATDGQVPQIDRQHAVALLRDCGSNVRQIESCLYERFQLAVQKGLPWPTAS